MTLKVVTAAIVMIGALALPTVQADAQTSPPKKRTVVYNNRDNTVQISRDEERADTHPRHHPETFVSRSRH